jgi:hypothetical protein
VTLLALLEKYNEILVSFVLLELVKKEFPVAAPTGGGYVLLVVCATL